MADSDSVSLVPIRAAELTLGQPVPWSIYNDSGELLLARGNLVESQNQLDGLVQQGLFRNEKWSARPPAAAGTPTRPSEPVKAARMSDAPTPKPAAASSTQETVVGMDEVRWQIGEVLSLQLQESPGVRYGVSLIGHIKNKSVLVTAPMQDGKYIFVREGQSFVVRVFSGRRAYAFTAAALKYQHSPHAYLHLSYPREVRCAVIRQGARAKINLVASVSLDDAHSAAATLTDLSMGGASGVMTQTLAKKGVRGRLKFKVHVAGEDKYLNLEMILRSVERNAADNTNGNGQEEIRHGFEFVDVSVTDRLILSAFVHQKLAELD
ncbi:flagellar brake protein [Herbaspirillum chlorophenolicum]|uniref:Flagellar brake protein n=1 Tax=Herbaspirillum chlorophenolicum TaxID=211589 RepID=A0ABW8EVW2_9BURK